MASPPFAIAETVPQDNDVASQFPLAERSFRDVVESWILVNHNVNGRHDEVQLDQKADPAAPGASITELWATVQGILKSRSGAAGGVVYVGVPLGAMIPYWGATAPDETFLIPLGQAISRTTYAGLFALIGVTFGAGDGSTTFNLPLMDGYGFAQRDTSGTVIGSSVLGTKLGVKAVNLPQSALPNVSLDTQLNSGAVTVTVNDAKFALNVQPAGGGANLGSGGGSLGITATGTLNNLTGFTSTLSGGAVQTATSLLQPTIVGNWIMKVL